MDMEPLRQIQTKRRHGSRWRCPSSRPPGRRFHIQTASAAQKQEQREEGLAETRSHTQANADGKEGGPVSCCKGWDLASRDTTGSYAQTHHSAVVQPGDHSWQTGQSGSLLAVCTVLLLFLYLPSLPVWLSGSSGPSPSACRQGSAFQPALPPPSCLHLPALLAQRPHIPTSSSSPRLWLRDTRPRPQPQQTTTAPINQLSSTLPLVSSEVDSLWVIVIRSLDLSCILLLWAVA